MLREEKEWVERVARKIAQEEIAKAMPVLKAPVAFKAEDKPVKGSSAAEVKAAEKAEKLQAKADVKAGEIDIMITPEKKK